MNPNYYELLGLPLGEVDRTRITDAITRTRQKITPHLNGPQSQQARQALQMVQEATRCLLSPLAKAHYDQQFLTRPTPAPALLVEIPAEPLPLVEPLSHFPGRSVALGHRRKANQDIQKLSLIGLTAALFIGFMVLIHVLATNETPVAQTPPTLPKAVAEVAWRSSPHHRPTRNTTPVTRKSSTNKVSDTPTQEIIYPSTSSAPEITPPVVAPPDVAPPITDASSAILDAPAVEVPVAPVVPPTPEVTKTPEVNLPPQGRILKQTTEKLTIAAQTPQQEQAVFLSGTTDVRRLAVTGDGRTMLGAGEKGMLTVWDTATKLRMRQVPAHTGAIHDLALSSDERRVLTAGEDHQVKLWEIKSGKEVRTLAGHTGPVRCVDFSSNGQLALSAGDDHTIRVWNLLTGNETLRLTGETAWIDAIFWPQTNRIISTGANGAVCVWDTRTREKLAQLEGHSGSAHSINLLVSRQMFLTAGHDGTVRFWDWNELREVGRITTGDLPLTTATLGGSRLLLADTAGTLRLWDINSLREQLTFSAHPASLTHLILSPDQQAFTVGVDDKIRTWNIENISKALGK